MTTMTAVLAQLIDAGRLHRHELRGCSIDEIADIQRAQGLSELPDEYRAFLALAGRGAGRLLRGSDAFYPALLDVKADAEALLKEAGGNVRLLADSLVLQLHQGYQAFWVPSVADRSHTEVVMFQEGDNGLSDHWDSLGDYLTAMASSLGEAGQDDVH